MTPFTFSNNIYINGSYYFEITEEIVPDIMRRAYYINEFGFVYNTILNRFEKPHLNDMNGYQTVYLKTMSGNSKPCLLHRLVCFTFNYNPNFKDLSVNHKDGNKLNNHYTNLEWMTLAENTRHALLNNLMTVGEDCSWSKLTESQVHQICKILEEGSYTRLSDISKKFNCRIHVIRDIALGITWTHISRQYDINYDMRSKMSDREVEQICQIFCNNKDKSFLYNYYLVLFTMNWEETSQNRKRIYKLYNRDPKCFKYITDKFDY